MLWLQLLSSRIVWIGIVILSLIGTHVSAYQVGYFKGVSFERAAWESERSKLLARAAAEAERLRGEGKRLAAELEVAKATVRVEYVEKIREVKVAASRTRACFTPDVAAILNRSTPIRETREPIPPPGQPAPAPTVIEHRSEAPAGGTSEAAAAEWVAGAQAAHEACRAQVGALADWIRSVARGRS